MKRDVKSTCFGDLTFWNILTVLISGSIVLVSCGLSSNVHIKTDRMIILLEDHSEMIGFVPDDLFEYFKTEFNLANNDTDDVTIEERDWWGPKVDTSLLSHFSVSFENQWGDIADTLENQRDAWGINDGWGYDHDVYHCFVHYLINSDINDTMWGVAFWDVEDSAWYGEASAATAVLGCKERSGSGPLDTGGISFRPEYAKSVVAHELLHTFNCPQDDHCELTSCMMHDSLSDKSHTPPQYFCDHHLEYLRTQRP